MENPVTVVQVSFAMNVIYHAKNVFGKFLNRKWKNALPVTKI
jgi:hypothetical protein